MVNTPDLESMSGFAGLWTVKSLERNFERHLGVCTSGASKFDLAVEPTGTLKALR